MWRQLQCTRKVLSGLASCDGWEGDKIDYRRDDDIGGHEELGSWDAAPWDLLRVKMKRDGRGIRAKDVGQIERLSKDKWYRQNDRENEW